MAQSGIKKDFLRSRSNLGFVFLLFLTKVYFCRSTGVNSQDETTFQSEIDKKSQEIEKNSPEIFSHDEKIKETVKDANAGDEALLHGDLKVLMSELKQISDMIYSIKKEHNKLSKGVNEINKSVKDMNERSDNIKKKLRKISKIMNKKGNKDLKGSIKNLQRDHKRILEAVKNSTYFGRLNSTLTYEKKSKQHKKHRKNIQKTSTEMYSTEHNLVYPNVTQNFQEDTPDESTEETTKQSFVYPSDCTEVMQMGNWTSGVYDIKPKTFNRTIQVWCDHTTSRGGWTVIVSRMQQEPQQDFSVGWDDYKKGFGDPAFEYWIGNDALHALTQDGRYELRVNITDWNGDEVHSTWKDFRVGDEASGYLLSVERYTSDSVAGDALKWHNSMKFSTPDRDNDAFFGGHCARMHNGGWWYRGYRGCHQAHPTGEFRVNPPKSSKIGPWLFWQNWRDERDFFPKTLFMMFRPAMG